MPKISQVLNWGIKELEKADINSAVLDAEILLIDTLNHPGPLRADHPSLKRRGFLYTHPERELTKTQERKYKKFITRRAKGEPVAYILGHKEFFGLDFLVNKNVLIPRPETEMMVDEILKQVQDDKNKKYTLIDIGTGSGCIPISIIKSLRVTRYPLHLTTVAIDISEKALAVARKNARLHGVEKKVKFIKSDLLSFLCHSREGGNLEKQFLDPGSRPGMTKTQIIITANLPYLPEKVYRQNYQGLKFEPRLALVAKKNGLDLYEKLLKQITILLVTHYPLHITILLELLPFQKPALTKLIKKHLPKADVKFKKDLAGKWRVAVIKI